MRGFDHRVGRLWARRLMSESSHSERQRVAAPIEMASYTLLV